jgi:hypothetical protein
MDLDSLYKGYAFENDIMVKANVANIRMRNVTIPAYYGDEQSKIKYGRFIIRTSSHLFKSYFWRIWNKYLKKLHFVGLLAILGILLLIGGLTTGIIMSFSNLLYILLPIGGAVLLLQSALMDVLIGIRLGKERKEKKK